MRDLPWAGMPRGERQFNAWRSRIVKRIVKIDAKIVGVDFVEWSSEV
jgi:hypothetical protein